MKQYSCTMIFLLSVSAVPVSIYAVLVSVSAVSAAGILCRRHTGTAMADDHHYQEWPPTVAAMTSHRRRGPKSLCPQLPLSLSSCRSQSRIPHAMLSKQMRRTGQEQWLTSKLDKPSFQSAALLKMKNDLMNDEYK